jgi:2'-5' RNA ligase
VKERAEGAEETIRAFVALDLDSMSARRLARIAEHLRMASGAPSASWTPPHKMHVTLRYVEKLLASTVPSLVEALAGVVDGKTPPRPGLLRLEAFPSAAEARVVVVELEDPTRALAKMAGHVERIVSRLGISPDRYEFRPHVTLARLKRQYDARRWLRPELAADVGECSTVRLTLYRSILHSEGSTYEPLASFEFVRKAN